jgi:hypothetical protein
MHTQFLLESLKGGGHSEYLGVDGRIMLEGVDWIHLAQNRSRWRVLVNTVNEHSGSAGDILTTSAYYQLLKNDFAPWREFLFNSGSFLYRFRCTLMSWCLASLFLESIGLKLLCTKLPNVRLLVN